MARCAALGVRTTLPSALPLAPINFIIPHYLYLVLDPISEGPRLQKSCNSVNHFTTEVVSGRVQEVAEQSQAQTLRVAMAVAQKLEKEIEAAVSTTAATAKIHTRTAVEGMRQDV